MPHDDKLRMWTVYDHPRDFPHCYVARMFTVGPGGVTVATEELMIAPDIEQLRKQLTMRGLVCLSRHDSDSPSIVETWL
jgi:hypothetical protein